MAEFDNILPPPSPAAIAQLERETQRSMPQAFLDFLTRLNGARTDGIAITSGEREVVIERFLAVLDNTNSAVATYDISVVTAPIFERFLASEDSDAYDLVPFAALFAGDFLCLDFRTGPMPSVVHWNHEKSVDFSPVTSKVADSFEEFATQAGL